MAMAARASLGSGAMGSLAGPLSPPSPIDQQVIALNGELDGLLESLNQLHDRLRPILHEVPAQAECAAPCTPDTRDTKLCAKLEKVQSRIRIAAGTLHVMLSELAI